MKFSELIIGIGIMLCINVVLFSLFFSYMKGNEKGSLLMRENQLVLKTDNLLRDEIDQIVVPYWENGDYYLEIFKDKILKNGNINSDIEIRNVFPIWDEDGKLRGMTILWFYNDRMFETSETFGSIPVLSGL